MIDSLIDGVLRIEPGALCVLGESSIAEHTGISVSLMLGGCYSCGGGVCKMFRTAVGPLFQRRMWPV